MAPPTSGRHRCACRAVLLALGDAPVLEQVGVEASGPRYFEHSQSTCAAADPALARLRAAAHRIGQRAGVRTRDVPSLPAAAEAPHLMPPPATTEAPPRPWSDIDDEDA